MSLEKRACGDITCVCICPKVERRSNRTRTLFRARLDGGGDFQLASLNDAEKPTLLGFWAPWCPICNQEAPNVETLAGELDVVAIGGRDEAANGPAFVAQHALKTPTVLFDESMASWEHYRIVGQPGAVLLDRDGHARWSGPMDNAEVLAAARAL
jgi:thiol-disulfide isomerase/thioredoxin